MTQVFPESSVERNLEYLYYLESIVAKTGSLYDKTDVEKFKKSIIFINGHCYIKIPCHRDILSMISSSYNLAKPIAQKVSIEMIL